GVEDDELALIDDPVPVPVLERIAVVVVAGVDRADLDEDAGHGAVRQGVLVIAWVGYRGRGRARLVGGEADLDPGAVALGARVDGPYGHVRARGRELVRVLERLVAAVVVFGLREDRAAARAESRRAGARVGRQVDRHVVIAVRPVQAHVERPRWKLV